MFGGCAYARLLPIGTRIASLLLVLGAIVANNFSASIAMVLCDKNAKGFFAEHASSNRSFVEKPKIVFTDNAPVLGELGTDTEIVFFGITPSFGRIESKGIA